MSWYFGGQAAFTPSAQNCVLDVNTATAMAFVNEVTWGGELTTSTAMRTRWIRDTTLYAGAFTAVGAIQGSGVNAQTSKARFGTFATPGTIGAAPAALYATSWNAHGGIGRWLAAPGEEWQLINALTAGQQLVCTNDVGAAATSMSTNMGWRED